MRDVALTWYVGLDAEATVIGDRLWDDEPLDDASMAQVVGLFALRFREPAQVIEEVRGDTVYLILAATSDRMIRMKPQNLVTGLPIRHLEAVT